MDADVEVVLQVPDPDGIGAVAVGPDGRTAATLGASELLVWDLSVGRILRRVPREGLSGCGVAALPDGRFRFADDRGFHTVGLGVSTQTDPWPGPATWLCVMSPDGERVAWVDGDAVYTSRLGGPAEQVPSERSAMPVAFLDDELLLSTPDELIVAGERRAGGLPVVTAGKTVWLTSYDGGNVTRTWDARRFEALRDRIPLSATSRWLATVVVPDEIAPFHPEPHVEIRDAATGRLVTDVPTGDGPSAHFVDDERLLIAAAGAVSLIEVPSGRELWNRDSRVAAPRSVAVSPSGRLATGHLDGSVHVWDLEDLRHAHAYRPAEPEGYDPVLLLACEPRALAWRGDELVVALGSVGGASFHDLVVLDAAGHERDRLATDAALQAFAVGPDGRVLVAWERGEVGWWEPGSAFEPFWDFPTEQPDDWFSEVAVHRDGTPVAVGQTGRLYTWADGLRTVDTSLAATDALALATDRVAIGGPDGVEVRSWPELELLDAWSTPADHVAFGPDGTLYTAGWAGGQVRAWRGGEATAEWDGDGVVEGLATRGSVVAVLGASVQLLAGDARLSLATDADGAWIAWTPDGLFDGARSAGDAIALVRGAESWSIDQVAAARNRPDVLLERMGLGSDGLRAHFAAQVARRGTRAPSSHEPTVTVSRARVRGLELRLDAVLEDPVDDLAGWQVWLDGVPLWSEPRAVTGRRAKVSATATLLPGVNEVEVGAFDAAGVESRRASVPVAAEGKADPRLFFVGFGVSEYRDGSLDLGWAHQDALDLAEAMKRLPLEVHARTWTDADVTPQAFEAAAAFLALADTDDIVVAFVAGHGMHARTPEAPYFFLPHGVDLDRLEETAVPFERIEDLVRGTPARRRVVLLDTCESGELEEPLREGAALAGARGSVSLAARGEARPWLWDRERFLYADLRRRTGAVVFSSSRGGEASFEDDSLRNGYFTEELLAALGTAVADRDADGRLSLEELRTYVAGAVARRSGDRQHPTVDRDNRRLRVDLPLR